MKFREYIGEEVLQGKGLDEGSSSVAYFISPRGELIDTNGKHISMIIKFPDKFGLTPQYIQDKYDDYNEKLGVEGKARNEILQQLIKQGWIRIRRYPNKFWAIDVERLDNKVKDRLYDFANKILNGIPGFKETDQYMEVVIQDMQRYKGKFTVKDLSKDILFNEDIGKRSRYTLVIKEIVEIM